MNRITNVSRPRLRGPLDERDERERLGATRLAFGGTVFQTLAVPAPGRPLELEAQA